MEKDITAREYQEAAARTINKALAEDMRLLEGVIGMTGEVGEVSEIIKHLVFHGGIYDGDVAYKLAEELGDVLWYIAEIATIFKFDLGRIMEINIEKLKKRYPDGFSPLGFNFNQHKGEEK